MKTFRHYVVSLMLALLLCAPVVAGEMDFPLTPPKPGAVETSDANADEPPTGEPPVEVTATEYITEMGLSIIRLTLTAF